MEPMARLYEPTLARLAGDDREFERILVSDFGTIDPLLLLSEGGLLEVNKFGKRRVDRIRHVLGMYQLDLRPLYASPFEILEQRYGSYRAAPLQVLHVRLEKLNTLSDGNEKTYWEAQYEPIEAIRLLARSLGNPTVHQVAIMLPDDVEDALRAAWEGPISDTEVHQRYDRLIQRIEHWDNMQP